MVFYEELGNDKNAIHSILEDVFFYYPIEIKITQWFQNQKILQKILICSSVEIPWNDS